MYIVPIAWLYVAFMMAVAEATNSTGSLLGAMVTFVLYGVAPVLLVVYLMGTPARKRAIKARELIDWQQQREAETRSTKTQLIEDVLATQQIESHAEMAGATNSAEPHAGGHSATAAQAVSVAPVRKKA